MHLTDLYPYQNAVIDDAKIAHLGSDYAEIIKLHVKDFQANVASINELSVKNLTTSSAGAAFYKKKFDNDIEADGEPIIITPDMLLNHNRLVTQGNGYITLKKGFHEISITIALQCEGGTLSVGIVDGINDTNIIAARHIVTGGLQHINQTVTLLVPVTASEMNIKMFASSSSNTLRINAEYDESIFIIKSWEI